MARWPTLTPSEEKTGSRHAPADSIVFAVFAPFGSDKTLSRYPFNAQKPIREQAIVTALQDVARQGVHVCALVDLVDDDSYWVEIPASPRGRPQVVSVWKQDMSHPRSLAGFLAHVHDRYPCSEVVLALEGHGAGYLPDVDPAQVTGASTTKDGDYEWTVGNDGSTVQPRPGSPALPIVSPILPIVSPILPAVRLPMSTLGVAQALELAQARGARRPAVIHFNNCFNLSLELLHTVRKHADYATAYGNYNFFTAGEPYVKVFARLRSQGSATRAQLARWFAEMNQALLDSRPGQPTISGSLRLGAWVEEIANRVDRLAQLLTAAIVGAADPEAMRMKIQQAIAKALQYDSQGDFRLEVPDQLTDLRSLAVALAATFPAGSGITTEAQVLASSLAGVRVGGSVASPYMDPGQLWNFRTPPLAINILLPDPAREGKFDWRTPYYMLPRGAGPAAPTAMTAQIEFLRTNHWVDFLVEYHRKTPFKGFLPVAAPFFPLSGPTYDPDDIPGKPNGPLGRRGRARRKPAG